MRRLRDRAIVGILLYPVARAGVLDALPWMDTICGLVRDAEDGQDWAMTALRRLARRGLIIQAYPPPRAGG